MRMNVWPKVQRPNPREQEGSRAERLERLEVIRNADSGAGGPSSNLSSTTLPNCITKGMSVHVRFGSLPCKKRMVIPTSQRPGQDARQQPFYLEC